ncbi:MAG: transglutaminase TgpA family protein [Acidimicrobiales bacterium]
MSTSKPPQGVPFRARRADGEPAGGPVAGELVLLGLSLAAGLGLARLTTSPFEGAVVWRVASIVVAGHAVVALSRRRLPVLVAGIAGLASVLLASMWWFVPGATYGGIPTGSTSVALGRLLRAAGTVIHAGPTPLPASSGVVLCVAGGAGCIAVLTRLFASVGSDPTRSIGRHDALVAVAPSAALFVYTSLLSSDVDRAQGAAAYITALVAYGVIVGRRSFRAAGPGVLGATLVIAVATVGLGNVAFAGMQLDAIPFHGQGNGLGVAGGTGAGSGIDALDLIDDMRAVITSRASELLFYASTPQTTYWQVATLDDFDGAQWTPDRATANVVKADSITGPFQPVLEQPSPTSVFSASVTLADFVSTLLPAPPGTLSLKGTGAATLVPAVGLATLGHAPRGLVYEVTAPVPSLGLDPGNFAGVRATSLGPYLALPRVAPAVVALARRIVVGSASPLAKAVALVRYLDSSRFTYSLAPEPSSSDPLSEFLFQTRRGFCQQFAAAFGVLARIDGLPTRMAVGFTSGTVHDGVENITGADAHVWPEVYLGPADGWVSFEPTPPAGSGPATPGVVSGTSAVAGISQPPPQSQTGAGSAAGPGSAGKLQGPDHPAPGHHVPTTLPQTSRLHRGGRGNSDWLWALLAVAIVLASGTGLVTWRGWSWWIDLLAARLVAPRQSVVASWRGTARALARQRLGRRPSETMAEHAERLCVRSDAVCAEYLALTTLAQRASYGDAEVTMHDAVQARRLRARVCSDLARRRNQLARSGWSRS